MGTLQNFILAIPALLFAMIAHEYAHGYAALKQGDPTAYQLGRLTWNPIKHIDPFMSILLPLVMALTHGPILGGAKPVPVNPRNYKKFKRGDIIVSLAGIVTNIVIAIVAVPVMFILGVIASTIPSTVGVISILQGMVAWLIWIDLVLAMFNLLPLPPLDGSHVFKYILPPAWSLEYQRIGQYGIIILIALLWVGEKFLYYWLAPAFIGYGVLMQSVAPYIVPSHFLPVL